MKRIKALILVVILLFTSSCTNKINVVNDEYIKTIPEAANSWLQDDTLILDYKQINNLNTILFNNSPYLNDLSEYNDYQKGIVVERCILRNKPNYNNSTETGLYVGMPVIITENQNNWYKIQTYFYSGWVESKYIALATNEEFNKYNNPDNFAVITEKFININNPLIDMGSRFPYLGVENNQYKIVIPKKNEDGNLVNTTLLLDRDKAHINYLEYSKDNLIIQFFKYLDTPYGWGDVNNGVDCSSLIANVYRTFGIFIPRNSSQQNDTYLNQIDVSKNNTQEKLDILRQHPLSTLYMKGHTMFYLGMKDDKHYIIHANGTTNNVAYEALPYINKILTINKIP